MAPINMADLQRLDALAVERGIALVVDAPMAPLTTLRVGGPADRLAKVHSRDELLAALALLATRGFPGSSSATAATWSWPTPESAAS